MKLINFYSNIWIISNFNNENITSDKIITYISKIKNTHNITKTINLDKEFKFWSDTYISKFNNTISSQIILDNQNKTINLFKGISKVLINSFINQKQILIFTSSKNNCLLGLLIFFICKEGNITLDNAIKTVNSKLGNLQGYILDPNIKKILISECYGIK